MTLPECIALSSFFIGLFGTLALHIWLDKQEDRDIRRYKHLEELEAQRYQNMLDLHQMDLEHNAKQGEQK